MEAKLRRHVVALEAAKRSISGATGVVDCFQADVSIQKMANYTKEIAAVTPTAKKTLRVVVSSTLASGDRGRQQNGLNGGNQQIIENGAMAGTGKKTAAPNLEPAAEPADVPHTKRARIKAQAMSEDVCKFPEGDDGFETYKKRGKQYNLMQIETIEHIKAYMRPERLPDGSGFLINFIAPIKLNKTLVDFAIDKAWHTYEQRVKDCGPRESAYREQQSNGDGAYTFDREVAAASDAFRVMTLELFSFLKSCVKTPSAFYNQIIIMKTRRAAFPYQLISSLGEPYKKVFELSWKKLLHSRPYENNIFRQMTNYQMKQVLAECLHKERQTRRSTGYYDESGDEESEQEDSRVSEGDEENETPSLRGLFNV